MTARNDVRSTRRRLDGCGISAEAWSTWAFHGKFGNLFSFKIGLMSGTFAPNGKRWLVSIAQKNAVPPFTVALNWPALLKK